MDLILNISIEGIHKYSDNPGKLNEEIILDLTTPGRIYITVHCKSSTGGYYSIAVYNYPS
ncbi:MAG: hypothetical protein GF311_01945 [Candidatus Lokiarchaeota archaeon]|nr:hypothetical protein [Candidatus Lokiarchaeota archaeon]